MSAEVLSSECTEKLKRHPLPHPQPARCRTLRARQACSEALSFLASISGELSTAPGTKPERRYEWWLGHLQLLLGSLLRSLEEEDAARR